MADLLAQVRAAISGDGDLWPAALAEVVRNIRRRRGLSLSQFAANAGITKAHAHDLEHCRSSNPTLSTLRGIASADAMRLSTLVNWIEDEAISLRAAAKAEPGDG